MSTRTSSQPKSQVEIPKKVVILHQKKPHLQFIAESGNLASCSPPELGKLHAHSLRPSTCPCVLGLRNIERRSTAVCESRDSERRFAKRFNASASTCARVSARVAPFCQTLQLSSARMICTSRFTASALEVPQRVSRTVLFCVSAS